MRTLYGDTGRMRMAQSPLRAPWSHALGVLVGVPERVADWYKMIPALPSGAWLTREDLAETIRHH